jgi:hypothetical protein
MISAQLMQCLPADGRMLRAVTSRRLHQTESVGVNRAG